MRALAGLLLVAACSGAPIAQDGTTPTLPPGGGGAPGSGGGGTGGGTPEKPGGITVGDLDGCNPAGTWTIDGAAQGTGTCESPVATLHLDLVVRATAPRRFEARRADGTPLQLARVRGAGGACELDLEELDRSATGPNLVLFYHLADAGTGLALRDEYDAGPDFKPETGRIHCTEGYDLTVKRAPTR
ncbi:MAG TPA: hypothetical protein VL172_18370 [Kofleriaceae bacterium]|nr:hypothetical protein [Kofleriaceae bacterium]